ncbi:MAG: hypothetical protein QOE98_2323 [Gaiellaceae bacterium]|nr:hypothetical protein [Gaiellaceae bacterium]
MPRVSFALVVAAVLAAIVPSAATGATVRTCAAADLAARTYPTGGSGAGTLEFGVRLRNVSGTRCVMKGFPGLGLRRGDETAMRGFAAFDKTKTPLRVVLANGGFAHAIIRYSGIPSAGDPATCPRSSYLLVTPPNRRVPVEVRARIGPCAKGRMLVSSIIKGKV